MGDLGTGFTDDALEKVEGQIGRIYRQASKDVDAKLRDFTERHKAREAVLRANVAAGKMTQDDFDAWMRGQVFQGQMWEARKAAIDAVLLHADEAAANVINTGRIGVFAENANYIGYNLEQGLGVTSSFTLYNDTSVVRLFREHPDMLPRPTVEKAKAYGYYNRTINNCITQGIIQGESIDKIARRISDRSGETNYKSAVRNARTAMTGAQNAGRIEGMRQAEKLGIDVQKQWVATLDNRTRDAHAELDGQIRDKNQPFDSALGPIMYPGDSSADPANVWNCRCSIVDYYPKYPSYGAERLDNETGEILPDMTYKEWKARKTEGTPKADVVGDTLSPMTSFNAHTMSNEEYLKWQAEHSTRQDIERDFYEKYGCTIDDAWKFDREIDGEWLYDIASRARDDLMQVQNGYGKCGYIQAAEGSKAINAYLRRGEIGVYSKTQMQETIDAMERLISKTTLDRDIVADRCAGIDALQHMGIDVGNVGKSFRIGHAFCTDGIDYAGVVQNINENYLGSVIVDNGFMSASVSRETNIFGGSDVTFTVLAGKGRQAFISDNTAESEIVFSPGTKQEIVGAKVSSREATDHEGKKVTRETIEIFLRIID